MKWNNLGKAHQKGLDGLQQERALAALAEGQALVSSTYMATHSGPGEP